jgi:hypothetical protein
MHREDKHSAGWEKSWTWSFVSSTSPECTRICSAAPATVSDMLVPVKSREVQRAMLAEMRGDRKAAVKHFLAAAHLELVLADDYAQAGQPDLALRSLISAASCFWSAGHQDRARPMLDELLQSHPAQAAAIQQVIDELERDYPARA